MEHEVHNRARIHGAGADWILKDIHGIGCHVVGAFLIFLRLLPVYLF
jgi:hypothetical protein